MSLPIPSPLYDRIVALRRDLHQHPELSLQEARTMERIASELRELGISHRTGVGGNGIVADLPGRSSGPRVALRADVLDAASEAEIAPVDRSQLSGPEFYALREHGVDEDARGVHALRSAALGTLVRRVTRGRMPRTVGVVLDLRRAPGIPRGHGLRRCEWSLGACATLVEELHRRGAEVQVLVVDATPEIMTVRGPAQLTKLCTLLSEAGLARHTAVDSDLLEEVGALTHCYWIAAGGFVRAPELAALPGQATLVEEERA